MILVVDSGSYKSDWMLESPDSSPIREKSKGLNPFFTKEKEIVRIIQGLDSITKHASEIREIYFFGSGCTNPDRREMMSNALSQVFQHAFISVENDLIGSAYATCGNEPGYTAVLGTGSNITFFDGEQVLPTKQGLGFILGDQGSGVWFGKKLITSFLYGVMPEELAKQFSKSYQVTKELVMKHVYHKGSPNAYLASFAPFMHANQQHPYIQGLLHQGFELFIKTHILLYPDYQQHVCHFVGGIAYHFQRELAQVCRQYSVNIGKIIKEPIEELYNFVIERETA
ncbi:N-acetylglucosamine kinase [Olivibacter sitiensis]|uniref:N-acetylglucosamine kinase n=1 Tax=Olivibacter sitiensis TaxID=376470 RepID=UPI00047FF44C|nr:N-acetylglucosamine kinase [Olivibacter sitiensis]